MVRREVKLYDGDDENNRKREVQVVIWQSFALRPQTQVDVARRTTKKMMMTMMLVPFSGYC